MKPHTLIALWGIGFVIQGCNSAPDVPEVTDKPSPEADPVRRIEIEVDDLERGLPCKVVHWPRPDTSEIIWQARFEKGFCHRKANESRLLLESRGWACQIEPPSRSHLTDQPIPNQNIVMAWQCRQGLDSDTATLAPWPPVPSEKPKPTSTTRADRAVDQTLMKVVAQDLATIARNLTDPGVTFEVAHGDLDSDNVDDAIVVLTRQLDERRWDRAVMAYLGSDPSYVLVDMQVSPVTDSRPIDDVSVDISDGIVRLRTCCDSPAESTAYVLRERDLVYYN